MAMKLKKIQKVKEPVPDIPLAEAPVPVPVAPAPVPTVPAPGPQAPVDIPQPAEEEVEEDWKLEEVATQTQQVFHNKKTGETLSLYEAITKILNAI